MKPAFDLEEDLRAQVDQTIFAKGEENNCGSWHADLRQPRQVRADDTLSPLANAYELDRIEGDVDNDIVRGETPCLLPILTSLLQYHWGIGWLTSSSRPADLKLTIIHPATQAHIDKYSVQRRHRITETPALYQSVHAPYIASFPESRLKWVRNILNGVKEADRVVAKDEDPELGWVMLPDLKWDEKTKSMLVSRRLAAV